MISIKLLFDFIYKVVQEYTVFGNPYMNVKLTDDVVTSYKYYIKRY